MKNYFENQPVHWDTFSPQDIIFKSNDLTKKLLPPENVLSYKSKRDRDEKMCKKLGGSQCSQTNWCGTKTISWSKENYKAVNVKLCDVKAEFPSADIDFIDCTPKFDSAHMSYEDRATLVYVSSRHYVREWQRDSSGNWAIINKNKTPLSDFEGYQISIGGQGHSNPATHRNLIEIADISQAIINFLVERILPLKRGSDLFELGIAA